MPSNDPGADLPGEHSSSTDQAPPPSTSSQPSPKYRRFSFRFPKRSQTDRYLSGVAGGVGQTFGVDPLFLRVGLVAATLSARYSDVPYALPLIAYVAAWFVMPISNSDAMRRPLLLGLRSEHYLQEATGALLALGVTLVLLSHQAGSIPLVLAGLSVMLLSARRQPPQPPPAENPGIVETLEPESPQLVVEGRGLSTPQRGKAPRTKRHQPALWPLTFGLLLLGLLGAIVADRASDSSLRPGVMINGAILVIGGVLVLSSWRGRARITMLWLVPLLPLWIGLSVVDTPRFGGAGSVHHSPLTVPESGELNYELGFGHLDLDLRNLKLDPGSTATISVGIDVGDLSVTIPPHTIIESKSSIGFGRLRIYHSGSWYGGAWYDGWVVADNSSKTIQPWRRSCSSEWIDHEAIAWAVATGNPWVADDGIVEQDPRILGLISADGSLAEDMSISEFELQAAASGITLLDHVTGDANRREEWLVQVGNDGQFCGKHDLEPQADEPATIVLRTTVGTGGVTIHGR